MAVIGNVDTQYTETSPDEVTAVIAQRFPTPPSSYGNLITSLEGFVVSDVIGLSPPYYVMAALQEEGRYMEERIGQIWPH